MVGGEVASSFPVSSTGFNRWLWLGLFFGGGGLALLDVVLVPGGDFGYVGAGFFDDALAAEAAVELEAGGEFEAVELDVFGLGDA